MSRLQFSTDTHGKEILELVTMPLADNTPKIALASTAPSQHGADTAPRNEQPRRLDHERKDERLPVNQERGSDRSSSSSRESHQESTFREDTSEHTNMCRAQRKGDEEKNGLTTTLATASTSSTKPYKGDNTIIMMEWERPYMRALVDALGISEETDVLEIGFGCGYSADRIQEYAPHSHTIMEPDPVVLERLRGWAKTRPSVRVVEGFWQTALHALGQFDAVFFDDFPLPGTPESSDLRGPASRWHAFIDLCIAHHLPVGGRITGYLARPLPLHRPGCKTAPLVSFPVEVPENCPYFPYGEAYIPLITRTENYDGAIRAGNGGCGTDAASIASATTAAEAVIRAAVSVAPPLIADSDVKGETGLPSRKRQKRLVFEALVQESLGLGGGGV